MLGFCPNRGVEGYPRINKVSFFLRGVGSEKFYRAGQGQGAQEQNCSAKQRVIGIFNRIGIELKLIFQWYFFDKHVLEYQNDQIRGYPPFKSVFGPRICECPGVLSLSRRMGWPSNPAEKVPFSFVIVKKG